MLKTLTHPDGRTFKMGRRRPAPQAPALAFGDYIRRGFPKAPPAIDYSSKANQALQEMYLNDALGDCVIAAMEHIAGVFVGNAGGGNLTFDDVNTKRLYSAIGGYVDGDASTDNGCDEVTALNYWQAHGLSPDGSHPIAGWVRLDGNNQDEVEAALWLFENCFFGVELPNAWVNPPPGSSYVGFVWDVAGDPVPENGHAFPGVAYDSKGVTISTWGMLGTITWASIAKYATTPSQGELYAVLGKDSVDRASQKAPNGVAWDQLVSDLTGFPAA